MIFAGMKNANIFHLLGVLVLHKSSEILSCVYPLRRNHDPAPSLHHCFLTVPPLSLHPLPSPISNCLTLPFGTQGRSWRLKPIPYKQETGAIRKASMPRSPTGSCSVSESHTLWPFCLASLTQRRVFKVRPCCSVCQGFLLWLNNIPLCRCAAFFYPPTC